MIFVYNGVEIILLPLLNQCTGAVAPRGVGAHEINLHDYDGIFLYLWKRCPQTIYRKRVKKSWKQSCSCSAFKGN